MKPDFEIWHLRTTTYSRACGCKVKQGFRPLGDNIFIIIITIIIIINTIIISIIIITIIISIIIITIIISIIIRIIITRFLYCFATCIVVPSIRVVVRLLPLLSVSLFTVSGICLRKQRRVT